MMQAIVDATSWSKAREALLAEEKALTSATDRVAALRRRLPWKRVDKDYRFITPGARPDYPTFSTAAAS